MIWVALAAAVVLCAVVAFARWWRTMSAYMRGKRETELRRWAEKRGWQYAPGKVSTFERRFPKFHKLQQGQVRYADNVVRGSFEGHEVWTFDYHCGTEDPGTGQQGSAASSEFSAAVVYPALRMLPLHIHPKGAKDKFGDLIGEGGIAFELAEFNRVFHVRASNERWAFDVLPQATLEFLLESPDFVIEFQDIYVAAWRNEILSAADLDDALFVIFGILERIPADIRRALQRAKPPTS